MSVRAAGTIGLFAATIIGAVGASGAAKAATMRLCTGSPGKTYIQVGETLARLAPQFTQGGLEIEVVPSGGSIDNIGRTLSGDCDAFIAQGDAVDFYATQVDPAVLEKVQIVGELYKELTLLLCRRGSGIGDLDEASEATVAAGSMGSGSLATFLNLQRIDPDRYGAVKVHPQNGFEGALAVLDGKADCLLDVIAPQSDLVQTLNDNERTGSQLYFAEIDNGRLEDYQIDGKSIYELVTFDDELYGNLATFGDPEMLAISAMLGVSRAFLQENPTAVAQVSMLNLMGQDAVRETAYGAEKPFD